MCRNNSIKTFIARALLVLFIFYYASSTLFIHSHIIDGEVITHSHPYSSTSHTHTGASIELISLLNNLAFTLCVISILSFIETSTRFFFKQIRKQKYSDNKPLCLLLRGPPALS